MLKFARLCCTSESLCLRPRGSSPPFPYYSDSLIDHFRSIKTQLGSEANKGNWITMFIHFFCLSPLGLSIKLNFNMSKAVYCFLRVSWNNDLSLFGCRYTQPITMFLCLRHANSTQQDSIPSCEISRSVFLENSILLAIYRPTPPACDFEFVFTKLYPGRLIFA